jgi:phosphate transport system permease protein
MTDPTVVGRHAAPGDTGGRRGGSTTSQGAEDTISGTAQGGDRPPTPTTKSGTANRAVTRPADRIFSWLTSGAGVLMVAVIIAIGAFLLAQAIPALQLNKANFLLSTSWDTGNPDSLTFGVLDLLAVTVFSSLFALVIAMPISLGIALFLTQYAPKRVSGPFAYVIDLLAAVPSIIYGLWGLAVLGPALLPIAEGLNQTLSFLPVFEVGNVTLQLGGTIFTAGVVLAVMLLPIITGVSREIFARTPTMHIEGALALGATKWEVVRTTVWPFGRSGFINASMLGLGRALGETIAVMIILSTTAESFGWSIFDGGDTIASKIARAYPEFSDPRSTGAYIAAGLVLFVLTLIVNSIARAIIAGKKEYE